MCNQSHMPYPSVYLKLHRTVKNRTLIMPFTANTSNIAYSETVFTHIPVNNDTFDPLFDTIIEEIDAEIIHDSDMNINEPINDMYDNNGNPIENYDIDDTISNNNNVPDDFVQHIDNNVHIVPEEPRNVIPDGTILNNLQPVNLLDRFNEVGADYNQIDENNNYIHIDPTSREPQRETDVDDDERTIDVNDDDIDELLQSIPLTPPRLIRQHAFHPDLTPRRDNWSDSDDEDMNGDWNQLVNIVTPVSLINYTDIGDENDENTNSANE